MPIDLAEWSHFPSIDERAADDRSLDRVPFSIQIAEIEEQRGQGGFAQVELKFDLAVDRQVLLPFPESKREGVGEVLDQSGPVLGQFTGDPVCQPLSG